MRVLLAIAVAMSLLTACSQPVTSAADPSMKAQLDAQATEIADLKAGIAATPTATSAPTPVPTQEPSPTVPSSTNTPVVARSSPTPEATPVVIELDGVGQQVTSRFRLAKGLAIFISNHIGKRNFSVQVLDSAGEYVKLVANTVGNYSGVTAFPIERDGDYVANVSADGGWGISILQPRVTSAPGLPQQFAGKGDSVSEFFQADGLHTFRMKHDGTRNFSVLAYDSEGAYVNLLANTVGRFDGSKGLKLDGRVYLLTIGADGPWSIGID